MNNILSSTYNYAWDLGANATSSVVHQVAHAPNNAHYYVISTLDIGAGIIHSCAGPAVNLAGKVINIVLNEDNHASVTNLIATVLFAKLAYEGGKLMYTPFSAAAKGITVEKRFKSEVVEKASLVKISDVLAKITVPTDLNNFLAKNSLAQAEADLQAANAELSQAAQALVNFDNLLTVAEAKAAVQAKENAFNIAENEYHTKQLNQQNNFSNIAIRNAAQQAQNAFQIAQTELKNAQDQLQNAQTAVQNPPHPREYYEDALKKAKEKFEKAKQVITDISKVEKSSKEESPSGISYIIKHESEKTKPKKTYINLPFSNEAIVIDHEGFKNDFMRASGGLVLASIGALGAISSFFNLGENDNSHYILGDKLAFVGSMLKMPAQGTAYGIGKTFGAITSFNSMSHGIGNIALAAGLTYGSYKLWEKTDLVWCNWQRKDPKAPFWKTTEADPFFKKKVIRDDLMKIGGIVSLTVANIFLLNRFFRGSTAA